MLFTAEIWYENDEITSKIDSDSHEIAVWIIIVSSMAIAICFWDNFCSVATKHEKWINIYI